MSKKWLALIIAVAVVITAAAVFVVRFVAVEKGVIPQVWSQQSPDGESYEFKVNSVLPAGALESGFLWDLDSVTVTGPDGTVYELEKDFNINSYSGEVTRRWVLYGPIGAGLPGAGEYLFTYYRDGKAVLTQPVDSSPARISYPTGVTWKRNGANLEVAWEPPASVDRHMWYKVLVWNEEGTPELFISNTFKWDAASAVMENVPLIDGGNYTLNVALYFPDGYAYSEYVPVAW